MKRKNLVKNVWGIGLTLLLLFGCSPQATLTATPIPPTPTSIPPTSTSIPSTSTPIPPTVPPASPTAINVQVEQARAFADPILNVIANYPPHFEDDFSTEDKGWRIEGEPKEGSAIQDGAARLKVNDSKAFFEVEALNRKDFVLQVDARVVEGDSSTYMIVHFHVFAGAYWFNIELNSAYGSWIVRKHWGDHQQTDIAIGQGNISPLGEWTRITIVAHGPRAAFYLNGTPVAYFEDANFDRDGRTSMHCTSFIQAVCEFDNVKFWELVKVPGLP